MFFFIFFNFLFQFFLITSFLYLCGLYASYIYLQNAFNFIQFIPFLIIFFIIYAFKSKNPIFSLLYILISFLLLSIYFFKLGIEFLTFTFLIVYIGALMMLFLFIIMLFNLQQTQKFKDPLNYFFWIYFFLFSTFYTIIEKIINLNLLNKLSPIYNFKNIDFYTIFFMINNTLNGNFIFKPLFTTENCIIFLIITSLLFFTLIAAITIALFTNKKNLIKKNKVYLKIHQEFSIFGSYFIIDPNIEIFINQVEKKPILILCSLSLILFLILIGYLLFCLLEKFLTVRSLNFYYC